MESIENGISNVVIEKGPISHERALELIKENLKISQAAVESKTSTSNIGLRFLQNEWVLQRPTETLEESTKHIKINGLSSSDQQQFLERINAAKQVFPDFVSKGTKIEVTRKDTKGLPGMLGKTFELGNKITLDIFSNQFPQETTQKVIIHELTHRGMKFLATHKPEEFKTIMKDFTQLFTEESRLVWENLPSRHLLGKSMLAFTRFGIAPSIDEASVDLISAHIFKRLNGKLPKEFEEKKHLLGIYYENKESQIDTIANNFLSGLQKINHQNDR